MSNLKVNISRHTEFINSVLSDVLVPCPNKKCSWQGSLRESAAHVATCAPVKSKKRKAEELYHNEEKEIPPPPVHYVANTRTVASSLAVPTPRELTLSCRVDLKSTTDDVTTAMSTTTPDIPIERFSRVTQDFRFKQLKIYMQGSKGKSKSIERIITNKDPLMGSICDIFFIDYQFSIKIIDNNIAIDVKIQKLPQCPLKTDFYVDLLFFVGYSKRVKLRGIMRSDKQQMKLSEKVSSLTLDSKSALGRTVTLSVRYAPVSLHEIK